MTVVLIAPDIGNHDSNMLNPMAGEWNLILEMMVLARGGAMLEDCTVVTVQEMIANTWVITVGHYHLHRRVFSLLVDVSTP